MKHRWALWILLAVGALAAFAVLVLGSAFGLALFRKKVNYPPPMESGSVGAVLPLSMLEGAVIFRNPEGEEPDPGMLPRFLESGSAESSHAGSPNGFDVERPRAGFENLLEALHHYGHRIEDLRLSLPGSERTEQKQSDRDVWYKPSGRFVLLLKGNPLFAFACQAIRLTPMDSEGKLSLVTDSVEPVKLLTDTAEPLQAIVHAFLSDVAGGRIRLRGTLAFSHPGTGWNQGRSADWIEGGLEVVAAGK